MQVGISTASLFGRENTEGALKILRDSGIDTTEVFLESFCEYNKKFGKMLNKVKGGLDVHSVHTLTTQFEPQLYTVNLRAQQDAFSLLEKTMQSAQAFGAKYYTFHGMARVKRTPYVLDFDRIEKLTSKIMDITEKHGVKLAYENVHWCYYNYVGFFKELKSRIPTLCGTLDIKQARQSGIDYNEFLQEMGGAIKTVHISDIDEKGNMCLPGKGITDFNLLFNRLYDVGFDGAILLEVYKGDYQTYEELFSSCNYVKELAQKVFNK